MHYNIAGHILEILKGELGYIPGFSCFISNPTVQKPLLTIRLNEEVSDQDTGLLYLFTVENATCKFSSDGKSYFFQVQEAGNISWLMKICPDEEKFIVLTNMNESTNSYILCFAIWIAFGIASLYRQTVAIHASAITYNKKAILFLGESGTGKSTQSQLWLQYIPDSMLLNDDSPFIRVNSNNLLIACGSPWSGKTPCYQNEQAPIAALIRLKQAPYNAINRLRTIEAIGALQPSLPPIFATDPTLSNLMYQCLSFMLNQAPVYSFDCLPNEDAANLIYKTLKEDGWI